MRYADINYLDHILLVCCNTMSWLIDSVARDKCSHLRSLCSDSHPTKRSD